MSRSFHFLSGDTNWSQKGGRWLRRVDSYTYHVIELAPRREYSAPYLVNLLQVDLSSVSALAAAAHHRGWALQSNARGEDLPIRIVTRDGGHLVATGASVRPCLVDAIADLPIHSLPIRSFRGFNHVDLRREAREVSLRVGVCRSLNDVQLFGAPCPECGSTRCGPSCPSVA